MRKSQILSWVAVIAFAGSLYAQRPSPGQSHRLHPNNNVGNPDLNVALEWNSVALTALQAAKVPPTVAARILAIVHGAMYDAWAPFDSTAVATLPGGAARQPSSANTIDNKSEAIAYAAYRTLLQLIPSQAQLILNTMASNLEYDPGVTTTSGSAPAAIGNLAAALQLAARANDGANQSGSYADTTGYQPVNSPTLITDPNHWQPLINSDGTTQTFVTPQWGQVTPFALQSGNQFRPVQPLQAGNWLYQQRLRDSLEENSQLDDQSKMSAEYWEDPSGTTSTAVGHWNLIGEAVSNRDQHNLDQDLLMFFALNEALLDTSISVWDAKRAFDYIRPVSVIHYATMTWPDGAGLEWSPGHLSMPRFRLRTGSHGSARQVSLSIRPTRQALPMRRPKPSGSIPEAT